MKNHINLHKCTCTSYWLAGLAVALLTSMAAVQAQTTGLMQLTSDTTLTQDHIGNIQIIADGVTLDCDGHSITSDSPGTGIGVHIDSRLGVTVQNCHALEFSIGFFAILADDVVFANNTASDNDSFGIGLDSINEGTVMGNLVKGSKQGITLGRSSFGEIRNNLVEDNSDFGIRLVQTNSSQVTDNAADGNLFGIYLTEADDNIVSGNSVIGASDAITVNTSNLNLIHSNILIGSTGKGIRVTGSDKNMVSDNALTSNLTGIVLSTSSNLNEITGNTVTLSRGSGIGIFEDAFDNDVSENTFELNCIGVQVRNGAEGNGVFNNNIVNNGTQAEELATAGPGNYFNLGMPLGGNYWNDFDEPAEGCSDNAPADGFCDSSYVFLGNQDAHPLIEMNGWLGSGGGQADDSITVDPCTSTDFDNDGVLDAQDNCPFDPNPDQADNDDDRAGDECDPDDDNDGVTDNIDNCPFHANPGQEDTDGNGVGDACTFDEDGDGVPNESDICPGTSPCLVVNEHGCSGSQLIDLNCDAEDFPNHGLYVSCVAHWANESAWAGLITLQEKAGFITQAAHSDH